MPRIKILKPNKTESEFNNTINFDFKDYFLIYNRECYSIRNSGFVQNGTEELQRRYKTVKHITISNVQGEFACLHQRR